LYENNISFDEGDIDKAMSEADVIVSGEVETHAQEHLYLEPHTALAIPKIEQREMDIYASTQAINEMQVKIQYFFMFRILGLGLFYCYGVYDTFNNVSAILWQSVLLVKETGVPRENHRPVTSH